MFYIASFVKKITLFNQKNYRTKVSTAKQIPTGTDRYIYTSLLVELLQVEVIFDVGANIGQTASKFAQSFPKAKIFSFEPVTATFKQLRENTKKNLVLVAFK